MLFGLEIVTSRVLTQSARSALPDSALVLFWISSREGLGFIQHPKAAESFLSTGSQAGSRLFLS